MEMSSPTLARPIAQAASAFEQQTTGHVSSSVAGVLNDDGQAKAGPRPARH